MNPSTSIFHAPHICIVFHPGTSGNFVESVVTSLRTTIAPTIDISSDGSAHNTGAGRKSSDSDYLSFGTLTDEHLLFNNEQSRVDHYLDKINLLLKDSTESQVVWTHDYTNIPIYEKFFPNSKILVITQESKLEQIIAVCMNVIKTVMNPTTKIPFTAAYWAKVVGFLNSGLFDELSNFLENKLSNTEVRHIVDHKFDPQYLELVQFLHIKRMIRYYGLSYILDNTESDSHDVSNMVLLLHLGKNIANGPPYEILGEYKNYVSANCMLLPYSYLINNDCATLTNVVSRLLDATLTNEQIEFIHLHFKKYRDSQNQLLLTDYVEFYKQLGQTAIMIKAKLLQGTLLTC